MHLKRGVLNPAIFILSTFFSLTIILNGYLTSFIIYSGKLNLHILKSGFLSEVVGDKILIRLMENISVVFLSILFFHTGKLTAHQKFGKKISSCVKRDNYVFMTSNYDSKSSLS